MASGERGEPGIRIRGVALFMDNDSESIGLSFCRANRRDVSISPGLATLLNGSTSKTSIKRKTFTALPESVLAEYPCRIVRSKNKTIALFEWGEQTPFAQVCSVLVKLGEAEASVQDVPRKISVDAMVLGGDVGEVADRFGCLKASKKHEVVVYEDRGENLSFLREPKHDKTIATKPTDSWGYPIPDPATQSGSERLQLQRKEDAEKAEEKRSNCPKQVDGARGLIKIFIDALGSAARAKQTVATRAAEFQSASVAEFLREPPREDNQPYVNRTRADKGQVSPPSLRPATGPNDHAANAFLEFQAVVKATRVVNTATCSDILHSFRLDNEGLLSARLKEADAAIYNNDTSQVIKGTMKGRYMAAYSATSGFVALDEEVTQRTGKLRFITPRDDPVVVTARCTEVMLDDRILKMADSVSQTIDPGAAQNTWTAPKITWINGVPGCGKTRWLVDNFDESRDAIVTTTTEAAKDLRERLARRLGEKAKSKVRTMASILVDGFRESM